MNRKKRIDGPGEAGEEVRGAGGGAGGSGQMDVEIGRMPAPETPASSMQEFGKSSVAA